MKHRDQGKVKVILRNSQGWGVGFVTTIAHLR